MTDYKRELELYKNNVLTRLQTERNNMISCLITDTQGLVSIFPEHSMEIYKTEQKLLKAILQSFRKKKR